MATESMLRTEEVSALQQLLTATGELLLQKPVESEAFCQLLPVQPFTAVPAAGGEGSGLPVLRYWPACLDEARASALKPVSLAAAALATLTPSLRWQQNPNYRAAPPDDAFLAHYGYAEICGPAGLVAATGLKFGVLLLGPATCYPAHRHPAEEIYLPLQSAHWQRDAADVAAGDWHERPAGSVIHHPTQMPHATRTTAGPLAALYLWCGAVGTDAQLDRPGVNRT